MIALSDEIKKRLAGALTDGHPVVVAYVNTDGNPFLSFYGSVHAYSDSQLALWSRNPNAEILEAIRKKPQVGLIYGDLSSRTYCWMYGRAATTSDEETRRKIFDGMHELERERDSERGGVAVLIELDSVHGNGSDGPFSMKRENAMSRES